MAKSKTIIAEASMSAGSGSRLGPVGLRGKDIELAMSKAVEDALAKGITDSDEILALKLKAREDVKKAHAAEVAKAEKAAKAAAKAKAKAKA